MRKQVTVLLGALAVLLTTVAVPGTAGGQSGRARVAEATTTTLLPNFQLPTTTAPKSPSTTQPAPSVPLPTVNLPPPIGLPDLASVRTRLVQVGSFEMPVALATRPRDPMLYVAEKAGRIRALDGRLILDIAPQVSQGDERGLLGLVFTLDGSGFIIDYTDLAGTIRVVEYKLTNGVANLKTRREILSIPHPLPVHNAGNLVWGPDRYLYIGVGDGGGYGDPGNNAQNLRSLLGKILRIDPRPSAGKPYTIPPTNPFANRAGARPEIWAWGLRNPWRFSFDAAAGNLWIGDVGQDHWEEIDFQMAASTGGQNYGWARMEGNHGFYGQKPPGAVGPIYEYPHVAGACAVTGGYVYRGNRIGGLRGAYLFGDFCLGNVTALLEAAGRLIQVKPLGLNVANLTSFGQDANGELYALSLNGPVFRIDPA